MRLPPLRAGILVWLSMSAVGVAEAVELRPETLKAWNTYVRYTDERIQREIGSLEGFLAMDFFSAAERRACRKKLDAGEVCISKRQTVDDEGGVIPVPHGMVHHWYGAILVPNASLERVVDFVQDYDRSAEYYDEVEESQLLSRDGDRFEIFLRLKRKKVITVHYNTEHEVVYQKNETFGVFSRSVATRIREVANAGSPDEYEKPEGEDRGFLWRWRSYWRFAETSEGTLVECESVSLSRDIPAAARWLVRNFLDSVPRESLESTLRPIRHYLTR